MIVTIAGMDYTAKLLIDTLEISYQLQTRDECSFSLKLALSDTKPSVGQEVVVKDDGGVRIFGGRIDEVKEVVPLGTNILVLDISSTDYSRILDRYLVAKIYENMLAGNIIKDINTNYLASEGLTTTAIEDGPTITKAVFNYISAYDAINEISNLTGYGFYIDENKDMHFFARETNLAPWSITDTQYNCKSLSVQKTTENYRNVQYIRAGQDITSSQTENFKGDGANKVFTVAYPIALVPTVKVNSVTKTIGIRGVDTEKNWYWNKNDKQVTQDYAASPLTTSDALSVTYQGFYPIIVKSEDTAEISARQGVEGGQGIYEAIEDDLNIEKYELATDKADALLRRYGRISEIVDTETDKSGLRQGHLITITVSAHSINAQYLIESVSSRYEEGIGFRHSVRALSGESIGGWVDFFRKLAEAGREFVIRENEVLLLVRRFSDSVILQDSFTSSSAAPDSLVGTAIVGFSEVAA